MKTGKNTGIKFFINIDLFGFGVHFFFGDDRKEQFLRETKEKDDRPNEPPSMGRANGNMVWLSDDAELHHLVHELHHAKWIYTHVLGVKCEETEAYIVGYLFEKAHKQQE
jgi:hypothetical protein